MNAALQAEPALVQGEFEYTAADFRNLAGLLYGMAGIELADIKAPLVYSRLAKRLRALGLSRFRDYYALLRDPKSEAERSAFLSALTTNVTRFFREPHHFDALRRQIEGQLAPAARAGARVRLWSAGCSLGHEPYSMAMVLLEALPEAAELDVRILATDIDPQVVRRAAAGRYRSEDLSPLAPAMRERWTRTVGDEREISAEVKALVRFGVLNLHAPWPMSGPFDVIFCRNVAIYFDAPTQARLWERMAAILTPEGRLYIGHSERAETPMLRTEGLTIYRRAG